MVMPQQSIPPWWRRSQHPQGQPPPAAPQGQGYGDATPLPDPAQPTIPQAWYASAIPATQPQSNPAWQQYAGGAPPASSGQQASGWGQQYAGRPSNTPQLGALNAQMQSLVGYEGPAASSVAGTIGGALDSAPQTTSSTPMTATTPTVPPAATAKTDGGAQASAIAGAAKGGTAAAWNQDGSYRLPTGEVLPPTASATLTVNGQQIRVPGNYSAGPGGGPALWTVNGHPEDAMGRLSRRLQEAAAAGKNLSDPNVIYTEMARIRDDALAAGVKPDQLAQMTGFAHLDRFVRGANGETGYTNAQGQLVTGQPGAAGGTTGGGSASSQPQTTQQAVPATGPGTAPPVPPTTGTGTGTGQQGDAAPMGAYYANGGAIAQQAAVNQFLAQRGIQVGNHNPYADFLRKLAGAITTPLIDTVSNSGGKIGADTLSDLPDQLNRMIYGGGGNVFTNLNQYAGGVVGRLGGTQALNGLSADSLQNLMSTITRMKMLGLNPYSQNVMSTGLTDMLGNYGLATANAAKAGATPPQGGNWFMDPANDPYGLFR